MNSVRKSDWRSSGRNDRTRFKWRKGRPVVPGADVSGNSEKWVNLGLNGYNFANLGQIYPWAKVFRGGVIPIWDRKVLLVKEKDRIIIDDEPYDPNLPVRPWTDIAPGYYGFAKGAVDFNYDMSILETAIREYEEEVGVKITAADIWYPTLIYERPEVGEVLIFFPIVYTEPPEFNVNTDELDGFKWFTLEELRPLKKQMSNPTRAIVHHLGSFTDLGT